jgi:hypothetical protein
MSDLRVLSLIHLECTVHVPLFSLAGSGGHYCSIDTFFQCQRLYVTRLNSYMHLSIDLEQTKFGVGK